MAHLLFVSPVATKRGGAPNSLVKLLKYLRADHETVVLMPALGELASALQTLGVTCHAMPLRLRSLPSLVRFITRGKFDLIYANGYHYRCAVALLASKLTRRPFVWHIREVLRDPARLRWLRYATSVVTISHAVAERVQGFVTADRIYVIPNGVDLEDFNHDRPSARESLRRILRVPEGATIVLNVGTICERKNQLHAIEAAAEVIAEHPSVAFALMGDFQDEGYVAALNERAQQLRLQGKVDLIGFRRDAGLCLCGADVLLHTAWNEPQGRVILEAMAARLPVVAYDVGGVSESLVHNETGFLIPFGDVSGLAQAISSLVAQPDLRQRMGNAGRLRVEGSFTAERTAQRVNAVISRVLR